MSMSNIEEATTSSSLRPKEEDAELALAIKEFENISRIENFNRVACKVRPISASTEKLLCELTVGSEHVNSKGTLHGGFSASLIDIITSRAIGLSVGMSRPRATIELSASYLLPVRAGEKITMTATVLQVGDSMAFAEVEFKKEDGKIAVKGKHTMAIF